MNNRTDILTLENFWNDLKAKYPKAVQEWCDWVDEYKESVEWYWIFCNGVAPENDDNPEIPKVHELPIAFQVGLFIQYRYDKKFFPGIFEIHGDWRENFRRFFEWQELAIRHTESMEVEDTPHDDGKHLTPPKMPNN